MGVHTVLGQMFRHCKLHIFATRRPNTLKKVVELPITCSLCDTQKKTPKFLCQFQDEIWHETIILPFPPEGHHKFGHFWCYIFV